MDKPQFYVNQFGDRYLHEVNRGAFNRLGAATVFQQHFGPILAAKDALVIALGTDSGALVRHVQQAGVAEGSRFVFIESDRLLPIIREDLADLDLDEAITLIGPREFATVLREVRFNDYANIGAIELIESIGAIDAYLDDYRPMVAEIKQQLDALLWAHNSQLSNPTFIRCQLQNLPEEQIPASVLKAAFEGKTAVLLGGGPSLDDILDWVVGHQQELVVLAVSRIARRLQEAGVTPHLVFSIDPNDLSFDISKEFLTLDPRILLVHANHAYSPLLAQWRGRSAYLSGRFPWESKLDKDNIGTAGPTVTNTAFKVACEMGFRQIIFGGIDLCHSSEGFTHARGSNEHDAGPRLGGNDMRVPTNSGRYAETSPDFFNAITSFSTQVQQARTRGIQVVNPAPGAAVIEGADYQAIETIRFEATDDDPFVTIHALLPLDSAENRMASYTTMEKELTRAYGRLRQVIKLSEEALECNDGLFGRNGKTADFKYKKRMDKIERQLDNKLKDVSQIVRTFSARAFLHMPPSDREWTDEELEQAGKTYYGAYRGNAKLLMSLIDEARERLASAREEEQAQPDFRRMLAQWDKDGTPGRAAVWTFRHAEAAQKIPDTVRHQLAQRQKRFDELLRSRDTGHARKVREQAQLGPVRAKLQTLFKQREDDELRNVVQQIRKLEGRDAAELTQLGLGYQAERAGRTEEAFAHYAQLIDLVRETVADAPSDDANARLEDALGRMIAIAMDAEQYDRALLILETLAELAPSYRPQLAELLRLNGDIEGAIAIYNSYLGQAPGDLVCMLRLGKLYQSIGSKEAAKTAYDYVLQQEPENQAARALLDQLETAA